MGEFIIVCGHYGCGKTNFSINLAVENSKKGKKVVLVDLDIVNPYFRSSDFKTILDKYNIKLIAPVYANSNLDIPSLPAEMYSIFLLEDTTVIIDVGGDDVGARVLGRFTNKIKEEKPNYEMFYIINKYRILSTKVNETIELLNNIEQTANLKATAILNNSHLKELTTKKDILNSINYAEDISKKTKLPLLFNIVKCNFVKELENEIKNIYPVDIFVKSSWE